MATTASTVGTLSPNVHILVHGASGAVGALISSLLLYPTDNLRTRMQAFLAKERTEEGSSPRRKEEEHKNLLALFKKILKQEGITGLYGGLKANIIGILASYGIYFFFYELFKQKMVKANTVDLKGFLVTSSLAGLITSIATNPIWVVHTRIVIKKEPGSLMKIIKDLFHTEGISGFFKGVGPAILLVINPVIQFLVYELLKQLFAKHNKKALFIFIDGLISKAIATFMTYPLQVVKTNLQGSKKGLKVREVCEQIYREEGIEGFFAGLSAKLSQTVLNSAFLMMFYEKIVQIVTEIILANQHDHSNHSH